MDHSTIWRGVDRLAAAHGLSTSGLAKKAGLDATSFNRSKRVTREGKKRWPSTESISRILEATGGTYSDFLHLAEATEDQGLSLTKIRFEDVPEYMSKPKKVKRKLHSLSANLIAVDLGELTILAEPVKDVMGKTAYLFWLKSGLDTPVIGRVDHIADGMLTLNTLPFDPYAGSENSFQIKRNKISLVAKINWVQV